VSRTGLVCVSAFQVVHFVKVRRQMCALCRIPVESNIVQDRSATLDTFLAVISAENRSLAPDI
jgi:hypothetical protein